MKTRAAVFPLVHPLRRAGVAALLACAALAASAQPSALPAVQRGAAGVEYVTGGIGRDESSAFDAAAAQWPLALEFAVGGGAAERAQFAADVQVAVRDARGRAVLEAVSGGPFLLARVAPGTYTVEAALQGRAQRRQVTVRQGASARAMFNWPAAAGDAPGGAAVTAPTR